MPYKSAAQRGYFHANRAKLEAQGVDIGEWDRASKGKHLPAHLADGGEADEMQPSPPPRRGSIATYLDRLSTPIPTAIQPGLQESQMGQSEVPEGYALNEQNIPFNKETGEELPVARRPSVLPITKTDEGTPQFAMPRVADLASNIMGGNVPLAGSEALLGAGLMKGTKSLTKEITGTTAGEVESLLKDYHASQAHTPLDISKFEKVGGQKGSNPGGVFADPDSESKWYIKTPQSADHANNEKLATELYKLAGVPVPEVRLTSLNGKPAIASKMIEGTPLNKLAPYTDDYSEFHNLQEHFPADAWLGNYDVVGTGKDNIIVDAQNNAHRIDAGGALRYRAQGKPKLDFGPDVKELKTMKDPSIAPDASDVFNHLGFHEFPSAERVAAIPQGQIADLVQKYGPKDHKEQFELYNTLIDRQKQIAKYYGLESETGGAPPSNVVPLKSYKKPQEMGVDPKYDADHMVLDNKSNPRGIANDMYEMALKNPEHVDEVYKHLPEDLQSDVNHQLTNIIEEKGDPWKGQTLEPFDEDAFPNPYGENDQEVYEAKQAMQASHEAALASGNRGNFGTTKIKYSKSAPLPDEAFKDLHWPDYTPKLVKEIKAPYLHSISPEEAKARGFNPNFPLYRGEKVRHGATPENPYPKEFIDPKNIDEPDYAPERAVFLADLHHVASAYSSGMEGEYIARAPKAAEVNWSDIHGSKYYNNDTMHKIIEEGHKRGLDLLVIHGMSDMGSSNHTQYAFLNTAGTLRATRAKFDPDKLHLRYPLAGLVGGGLFAYGTLKGQGEGKMKRGGSIDGALRTAKKYASGGGMDSWMMHQASRNLHYEGMIKSGVPGRTDKLPMNVPAGSYVLPADIPSALGQGNTMAGGKILQKMFNSGPGGMPLPKIGGGRPNMPRLNLNPGRSPRGMGFDAGGDVEPLPIMQTVDTPSGSYQTPHLGMAPAWAPRPSKKNAMTADEFKAFKSSLTGKKAGGATDTVPIIAAGGEFTISPEVVKDIGHGDLNKGHKVLDAFVLHVRKQHIATLKKLPGPKK